MVKSFVIGLVVACVGMNPCDFCVVLVLSPGLPKVNRTKSFQIATFLQEALIEFVLQILIVANIEGVKSHISIRFKTCCLGLSVQS
jgi:hypothetical protein